MQADGQNPVQIRTGKKNGIWWTFLFALAMHALFLLAPITRQIPVGETFRASIELQLTTFTPPAIAPVIVEPPPEPPLPEPEPEFAPEPPSVVLEEQTRPVPAVIESTPQTTILEKRNLRPDLETMSNIERRQLANTVLARQFFTEESALDQLFGKPLPQYNTEIQKEFHYPLRENMISMLDQPLPEVPFAYAPDLVYFAYEPGVKGDLQRFWDVITPEFGWRTKYGTEVRCVLVLVIIGCGWK
ncbi:MAG: hypothetical protein QNK19_03665 [Xanthomonadales bacterium]|nr:hypothetical protein [Xanthomonadales bacterium]